VLKLLIESLKEVLRLVTALSHVSLGVTDFLGITDPAERERREQKREAEKAARISITNNIHGIDENAASSQIADSLRPVLREAAHRQRRQLESAATNQKVARALRGEN